MLITIHLSDGRKITKSGEEVVIFCTGYSPTSDDIKDGKILINQAHIVDIRLANKEETEHAEIHGW